MSTRQTVRLTTAACAFAAIALLLIAQFSLRDYPAPQSEMERLTLYANSTFVNQGRVIFLQVFLETPKGPEPI